MSYTPGWDRVVRQVGADAIEPELLRGLADGEIAVIALKGLLPSGAFAEHRKRVELLFDRAATTQYVNGALTTIGPYLNKYIADPDAYFAEAAETQALFDEVAFSLGDEVRAALAQAFGLSSFEPAREADGREYASSVVRIHADGVANPLHNDNIMRDAKGTGLRTADLLHQLSCVVCVQECETGGELLTYGKRWIPADEQFKIKNGLGYEYGAVEGAPVHEFKPSTEDVYLLNPTYFHEIARVGGSDRLTLGFFFGFDDDGLDNPVAWG